MIMENSRIWIYLSDKEFSKEIETQIESKLNFFLGNWKAHDNPLRSFYKIERKRFIIIGVDESQFSASGCSIDKQLKLIKELENDFSIQLLNRLLIAYEINGSLHVSPQSKINELIKEGKVNAETFVYNNAINQSVDLENNWRIPLKNSWLAKYIDGN